MSRDFRHDTEVEPNMRTSSPVSELVDVFERFDMDPGGFLGERGSMEQDPTGDWVRYSDAVNALSAQNAVVADKNSALQTLSTRNAELEREVKRLREFVEAARDYAREANDDGMYAAADALMDGGEHE